MTDLTRLAAGELVVKMGIQITEMSTQRATGTMPVEGNRQPYGLLHGGASAVLAETLGSLHAAVLAPAGRVPVGTDLNCTHHRAMTAGTVYGVCVPAHVGRSVACFEIVISDETGRRVCTARLTCAYIDAGRTSTGTQATPR
jgi:1,4-dihydroxy-2-naphthoyl-CoA hydrolase